MNLFRDIKVNKKKLIIAVCLIASFIFLISSPLAGQAFNFAEDSGLSTSAETAGFATGSEAETVDSLVGIIIYAILGLVGVVFLALMIYSGFRWMIAQGNEERINKAKDGLISALVGLIITLGAYAISYFLISYFS